MTSVRVASFEEIPPGEVLAVEAGGRRICLARVEDVVYAFEDQCSHREFLLSSGELDPEEHSITCEWHGARFDIRSGKALSLPATRPVRVFPCRVDQGDVFVEVG
jgi:3-phenylpropionate/trans-cinnamate dioxygenase ferredoxin component